MMHDELTALMGRFKRVLSTAADLIILNILLLLCCLPVITIGAAWTACYSHVLRVVRGQEAGIPLKSFFVDFGKAFRTATPVWLILLLCAIVVAGDYYFAVYANTPPNLFFLVFSILMAVVLLFVAIWLFPLMARFNNSVGGHIRNAILMAIGAFPKTLLAAAVQLSFYVLPLYAPALFQYFGWLWLMFGLSLPLHITARIFRKELDCIPKIEDEPIAKQNRWNDNNQD